MQELYIYKIYQNFSYSRDATYLITCNEVYQNGTRYANFAYGLYITVRADVSTSLKHIIFARSMINEQAFSIYKRKVNSSYYSLYAYIIDTKRLTWKPVNYSRVRAKSRFLGPLT